MPNFSSKQTWDADDGELARRVYPAQRVWLSDSRKYLYVGPPDSARTDPNRD